MVSIIQHADHLCFCRPRAHRYVPIISKSGHTAGNNRDIRPGSSLTVVSCLAAVLSYNNPNQNAWNNPNQNGTGYNYPNPGITPRSIPVCVILSIITCGIYGIYWMIKLNDEINLLAGEPGATSGGMVFLFSIITCGIYGLYWQYKMGEKCDRIKRTSGSSGILYLILAIVGFGIIGYCLMQDTINKAI